MPISRTDDTVVIKHGDSSAEIALKVRETEAELR